MNTKISILDNFLFQNHQERFLNIKEMVRLHSSHNIFLKNLKSFDEKNAKLINNFSCPISRPKKVNLDMAINY